MLTPQDTTRYDSQASTKMSNNVRDSKLTLFPGREKEEGKKTVHLPRYSNVIQPIPPISNQNISSSTPAVGTSARLLTDSYRATKKLTRSSSLRKEREGRRECNFSRYIRDGSGNEARERRKKGNSSRIFAGIREEVFRAWFIRHSIRDDSATHRFNRRCEEKVSGETGRRS